MTRHDPLHGRHELATYYFDPRFTAGGKVSDHSGRGHDLTPNGGVSTDATAGPTDFGAAKFDGVDDYHTAGTGLTVDGPQALALVFRVDTISTNNGNFIAGNGKFNGNRIFVSTSSRIVSQVQDGNDNTTNSTSVAIDEGVFYSAVSVATGSTNELYVDGELAESVACQGVTTGSRDFETGRNAQGSIYSDVTVAFVAKYDLSVPTAPNGAEIARRVDELTSVPRTRL